MKLTSALKSRIHADCGQGCGTHYTIITVQNINNQLLGINVLAWELISGLHSIHVNLAKRAMSKQVLKKFEVPSSGSKNSSLGALQEKERERDERHYPRDDFSVITIVVNNSCSTA